MDYNNYRKIQLPKDIFNIFKDLVKSLYPNVDKRSNPRMVLSGFKSGTRVQSTADHDLPEKELNSGLA